jgi:glycosyltransferase involved in cell wall biosynthesis
MNVFVVDIVSKGGDNGVKTYVKHLQFGLPCRATNIKLSIINIGNLTSKEYFKTEIDGVIIHHMPLAFIGYADDNENYEDLYYERILDILEPELIPLKNIIFHFNWINHSGFAGIVKKRFNALTLLTKHCIPWKMMLHHDYLRYLKLQMCLALDKPPKEIPFEFLSERSGYKNYDQIITVTNIARRNLINFFNVNSSMVKTINNGVAHSSVKVKETRSDIREKLGFEKNHKLILFVGRQEKINGFLIFLCHLKPLLKLNRNIKVILTGDLVCKEIVDLCEDIWASVIFTSHVDRAKLIELYRAADVGLMPSLYEQCSYVALEMIQNGLPVIAAEIDGLKEMFENDVTGITIPLVHNDDHISINGELLCQSILTIFNNGTFRRKIAKNAKRMQLSRYNLDSMLEETILTYGKLTSA